MALVRFRPWPPLNPDFPKWLLRARGLTHAEMSAAGHFLNVFGDEFNPPLAGVSALAHYSVLAEPAHPVYAVSPVQWKTAETAGVEALPAPHSSASECQVWSYIPIMLKPDKVVDPLSLTLSLKEEKDDREQRALEELEGQFPW